MDDQTPVVEFQQLIHGTGTLTHGVAQIPVASFSLQRGKYNYELPWLFRAHIAADHWEAITEIVATSDEPLQFHGETDRGRQLSIPRLYWTQLVRGRLDAEIDEWNNDVRPLPEVPDRQHVLMRLSDTPLALPTFRAVVQESTGEIKSKGPKVPPMQWQAPSGIFRFSKRYEYEKVKIAASKATVQIPIATFAVELDELARSADTEALIKRIERETESALRVISFLSRRHVSWFRMRIIATWQRESIERFTESEWNRSVSGKRSDESHPLVNPHRLSPEALGRLIDNFESLSFKVAAGSAVVYLIESFQSTQVESRLANAFTALEALVSGIGEANRTNMTLGASQFSRLGRKLRDSIQTYGAERRLSGENIRALEDKIPELRRRPIVNQVVDLLYTLNVPWEDLWPSGTEIRSAIKEAFARRNQFVHAGKLHSGVQANVDAIRIHALAERILFISIRGDFGWQDFRSYHHASGLAPIQSLPPT